MPTSIDAVIERLWLRMTAIYGQSWTQNYGEIKDHNGHLAPLAQCWADTMRDVQPGMIAKGINACMTRENTYPPSLPEFLRLCGVRSGPAAPYHRPVDRARLPAPGATYPTSPSQRCANLAEKLQRMADEELTPRLLGLLPEERKDAMRAYWMSQISQAGDLGRTVARRLQAGADTPTQDEEPMRRAA